MLNEWPEFLIVGNSRYALRVVKRLSKGTLGLCDTEKKEIYILERLSTVDRVHTLIHELLHAIEAEARVEIDHKFIYLLEKFLSDALIVNDFLKR